MAGLRELKVVLDTNVIYNVAGGELLKEEVGKLINASSSHADLLVTWYLPEAVKNEREHQLRQLARKSVSAIQKLERVLDLDLGISDQMIVDRIRNRIDSQIAHLNLRILPVDPSGVDWAKMMLDAAFREPPFSPGEHEKGFRDALIVEAVNQLIASSAPSRIAVVTGDELLTTAIVTKTGNARNVHVLSSIEELKGFINTLVSNVEEAFIQRMNAAATNFFFEPANRESYVYKQGIKETILKEFNSVIYSVPEGASEVERGKALVSRPRFKKKVGNRMYWVSRIAFRMKAYDESGISAYVTVPFVGYSGHSWYSVAGYSAIDDDQSSSDFEAGDVPTAMDVSAPNYSVSRFPTKIGYVAFEVTWSVSVTLQHTLTHPKIESIEHVETSWN